MTTIIIVYKDKVKSWLYVEGPKHYINKETQENGFHVILRNFKYKYCSEVAQG